MDAVALFRTLRDDFTFDFSLKREQLDVLNALLKAKDVVAILPTGFGKSMCYALLPLFLDKRDIDTKHIAIVISPLNSLMEDQKKQLSGHQVESVILTGSTPKPVLKEIVNTTASVVFTSPELITSGLWRDVLMDEKFRKRLCLLTCDEAHCVSEWGESFRPDFREIANLRSLVDVPILALTATATEKVASDIYRYLLLDDSDTTLVQRLPDRPNIVLGVMQCTEHFDEELLWLREYINTSLVRTKKTIIYCRTYSAIYEIWSWLVDTLGDRAYNGNKSARSRLVEMFHSSTDAETKQWIISEFTTETSSIRVLVCTVAFGMGINVPDIDIIVHWGCPQSILSYWQEVGRAGRRGQNAAAVIYAFKRSTMKTVTDDNMRTLISSNLCIRHKVMSCFKNKFLDDETLNTDNAPCIHLACSVCQCSACRCCSVCMRRCACKGQLEFPLNMYKSESD